MEGALKESQQIVRFTLRYYQIFIDYLSITVCRGRRLFVLYISIIPMFIFSILHWTKLNNARRQALTELG